MTEYYLSRVSPFGYPRIVACLQLPEAFRSLPRPSSAPDAKASTICLSSLAFAASRLRLVLLPYFLPSQLKAFFLFGFCSFSICCCQGSFIDGLSKLNSRVCLFMLLRKEVIQPHLPIRLPCYDFTPITSPTFDGSSLTVKPPASGVTDFRGVTGGVYKARERIHRGILIRDY